MKMKISLFPPFMHTATLGVEKCIWDEAITAAANEQKKVKVCIYASRGKYAFLPSALFTLQQFFHFKLQPEQKLNSSLQERNCNCLFANLSLMNSGLELRKFANVYTLRVVAKIYFFSLERMEFFVIKRILIIYFNVYVRSRIVEKKRHTSTVDVFSMYSLSNHTSYVWLDDSIVFLVLS